MIFFRNSQMRKDYQLFPRLILIDGTYRVNNYYYTLIVFLDADQDRKGRVVGISYIRREDSETYECFDGNFL